MVTEAEVVADHLIARARGEAPPGADRLYAAVADRLGQHPVLGDLAREAAAGAVSDLTRRHLELALTAAAHRDGSFARTVAELAATLRTPGARVYTGDAHAAASGAGIAFGQVGGDVYIGGAGPNPTGPGR